MSARAAGALAPGSLEACEARTQLRCFGCSSLCGSGERQAPIFDASVPVGRQAGDVRPRISCQHQAHGGYKSWRELAPPQHDVDERAADATIAVGERMDGLKLCMCDRSLDERGHVAPVEECGKVFHEIWDVLSGWRHEIRLPWVESVPANPVLTVAELARHAGGRGREHQHAMDREHVGDPQRLRQMTKPHGLFHRGHVPEHRTSCLVPAALTRCLCLRQAPLRELESFDTR